MTNQTSNTSDWISRHKFLTGLLVILVPVAATMALCDRSSTTKADEDENTETAQQEDQAEVCNKYCSTVSLAAGFSMQDNKVKPIVMEAYKKTCLDRCYKVGTERTRRYIAGNTFCTDSCYNLDMVKICLMLARKNKHLCYTKKMKTIFSRLYIPACISGCNRGAGRGY